MILEMRVKLQNPEVIYFCLWTVTLFQKDNQRVTRQLESFPAPKLSGLHCCLPEHGRINIAVGRNSIKTMTEKECKHIHYRIDLWHYFGVMLFLLL